MDFSVIMGHLYKMENDEICEGMPLNLNEVRSSWKHMWALQEDNIQDEKSHKRLFAYGCGGQPFTKIQKHTVRPTIYVKGLENHRGGTSCL